MESSDAIRSSCSWQELIYKRLWPDDENSRYPEALSSDLSPLHMSFALAAIAHAKHLSCFGSLQTFSRNAGESITIALAAMKSKTGLTFTF